MDLDDFLAQHVSTSPQQRHYLHFTDEANLASIRKHGLLSMRQLKQRGIEIPAPGGNQWSQDADAASGMDAYVHLCFVRSTGQCNTACSLSAGVSKPKVFRGR